MRPLLWLDVETGGFEPGQHGLFEIGMALTNERLEIVAETSVVIFQDHDMIMRSLPMALEWHTKNGLLREVVERGLMLNVAEHRLKEWCAEHGVGGLYTAGSKPAFDRSWLKAWTPSLNMLPHHRTFDLNTLLAFHGAEDLAAMKEGDENRPHRALLDIRRDVGILKLLAQRVGVLPDADHEQAFSTTD